MIDKYRIVFNILADHYGIDKENISSLLKEREKKYIVILLLRQFRCLEKSKTNMEFVASIKNIRYYLKKAEEKLLINSEFRKEYFELEEKIKESF